MPDAFMRAEVKPSTLAEAYSLTEEESERMAKEINDFWEKWKKEREMGSESEE